MINDANSTWPIRATNLLSINLIDRLSTGTRTQQWRKVARSCFTQTIFRLIEVNTTFIIKWTRVCVCVAWGYSDIVVIHAWTRVTCGKGEGEYLQSLKRGDRLCPDLGHLVLHSLHHVVVDLLVEQLVDLRLKTQVFQQKVDHHADSVDKLDYPVKGLVYTSDFRARFCIKLVHFT